MQIDKIISGRIDNNTYILTNKNSECLIVDCSCSLEEILKRVKENKVVGVLLTHGHYDHFSELDNVIRHFNVKCYVSLLDAEKLFNPKMNYSIIFNKIYTSKLSLEEDFVLLNSNISGFKVGGFNVSYVLTPGHTNGGVCYLVDGNYLFTGDTLFADSCGRTDLLTGSEEDMQKSLNYLKDNFAGLKFYPGHGDNGTVK